MKSLKAIRQLVRDTLHRFVGSPNPPPGWWIETDGRRYRWAYSAYTTILEFHTRRGAVMSAWERLRAIEKERKREWRRVADSTSNPTLHRGGTSLNETEGKADE